MEKPKQKILWITENYPPQRGGMAVSCDRIVRVLRQKGLEIDVAHFSPRYLKPKTVQKIGGRFFACPVNEDVADSFNQFWLRIENENYTHIAAFGGLLPLTAAPVFAKWLDAELVTLIRGNDFDAGIFSIKRGDILREALANSSAICAVSKDKVWKISKLFPDKTIFWTPNGIESEDWKFEKTDKKLAENWRVENKIEDKKVLGLFGQLKRKKGGLFFLENLLRSGKADKFHLLIIGDAEPEMNEWLAENAGKISFSVSPFLDRFELLPFYAACDFTVVSSFYDGMPNVLLESAALGIPLLASDAGGMRDVLIDDKTALLFAAGNEHECRKAIRRAAEIEKEDYEKLQENCRELAENYRHEQEAENYLKIFSSVLSPALKRRNADVLPAKAGTQNA